MFEKKLLELTTEYANCEADEAILAGLGMAPDRIREQIATEYGQVPRAFLNG